MDKIRASQAVDIFMEHRTEILKAVRSREEASGYRILAEVDFQGNWLGARVVTEDNESLLAQNDQGYALYIDCNQFKSRESIAEEIFDWEEQIMNGAREGQEEEEEIAEDSDYEHDKYWKKSYEFFDDYPGRGR